MAQPELHWEDLPACPDCTAHAGEECREPDGAKLGVHERRLERFEREHRAEG